MIRPLSLSAILISVISLVSSCMNSDEATSSTAYEDTAITSFTLGTVKVNRYIGKKKAAGYEDVDSFYTYSYTGSKTPVYIDHLTREIYNTDSLPAGSYMKMLTSVTSKNSNTITYRDWDADDNAKWTAYSSSDSIKFVNDEGEIKPLRFRVWSSTGSYTRDYKVQIVSHKEYADSFQYVTLTPQSIFADAKSLRGTATSKGLYVLVGNGTSSTLYLGTAHGTAWTTVAGTYGSGATIASDDEDNIYILDGNTLYHGSAAPLQTADVKGYALSALAGNCKDEVYAVNSDGKMMVAHTNNLATWTKDAVYDSDNLLPAKDISYATAVQKVNSDVTRITIVGNKTSYSGADTCAVVWNKNVNTAADESWIYNDATEAKTKSLALPAMTDLSATGYYNGWILAIGGEGINTDTPLTTQPYKEIFCSEDGGTSWHKIKGLRMPDKTLDSSKTALIVADEEGFFYIISADGGKVYRCKLNNATWDSTEWKIKN